jgi:phage terminase large subunit-like protein
MTQRLDTARRRLTQSLQREQPQASAEELAQAVKILENPLLTVVPTGKQDEFLALTSFIQVFSGGNWGGKTAIGATKLGTLLFRPENPLLQRHRHLYTFANTLSAPKCRFRIASTHTAIEQDLIPALKRWWPKGRYSTFKGTRPFEARWQLDTGAWGDIMTYDQDPEEFEAVKLDVAWFDEPPPYDIFKATIARMKPHGIIMLTMTPLAGAAYVFDRVNSPWATKSWGLVYADIESACLTHGVRGYLPHDAIEKKAAEYDEEEKQARIQGLPMHLAGLVYKEFATNVHVIAPYPIPAHWTRYMVCDPHDRKPFAMTWAAVSPQEKVVIYDEYPNDPFHLMKSSSLTVSDYVKVLRLKEEQTKIFLRIIDARYSKRHSAQTGKTIRDLFDDHGIMFVDSYLDQGGNIEHGHQQVKEWLKPGSDGTPTLTVFNTCQNTIYGFQHYSWDDHATPERGLREKVKDMHKDFMDNVRYLRMEEPRYVEPQDAPPPDPQPPPERWGREATAGGYGATSW